MYEGLKRLLQIPFLRSLCLRELKGLIHKRVEHILKQLNLALKVVIQQSFG
ncbi:hypothetical protein D3C72_1238250 [compost metagenome]